MNDQIELANGFYFGKLFDIVAKWFELRKQSEIVMC